MSRRRIHGSSRAAFTLMEVLLVLVILVVLGSLAVGMFTGAQKKANLNAAQAQVDSISQQCLLYFQDMNTWPTQLTDLRVNPGSPKWNGPYLDKDVPKDPWDNEYNYQYQQGMEKPDIWSNGPPNEANAQIHSR